MYIYKHTMPSVSLIPGDVVPEIWTYHEVDGATTTQDVGTGDNGSSAIQPFRGARVVK